MEDWGTFLNKTAQGIIGAQASTLIAPAPATSVDAATGVKYDEGKPVGGTVAGIPMMYVVGGVAVLALVGYFALRK
ncbi:MAG: hypothetical protein WCZ98_01430 [Sideroxydans sp.]